LSGLFSQINQTNTEASKPDGVAGFVYFENAAFSYETKITTDIKGEIKKSSLINLITNTFLADENVIVWAKPHKIDGQLVRN